MARKKRQKPYDPAEQSRLQARRAERRELEARGITVNYDPRTEEITARTREDCFSRLLKRQPEELGAVLWLEQQIRISMGEAGTGERYAISSGSEGAPGQGVTMAMIDAGDTVQVVKDNLYPACARLLFGLLEPDAALETNWREVVMKATGETHTHAQAAMVRASAANLTWVRNHVGRLKKERQAQRQAA